MDMSLSKLWDLMMHREAGNAACPWGHKESDMTEWLNWTELMIPMLANLLIQGGAYIPKFYAIFEAIYNAM